MPPKCIFLINYHPLQVSTAGHMIPYRRNVKQITCLKLFTNVPYWVLGIWLSWSHFCHFSLFFGINRTEKQQKNNREEENGWTNQPK